MKRWWGLAVLCALACNRGSYGTALYVTVQLGGAGVDQLELGISQAAMTVTRPETAGGPLTDPQTVRLFLPDSLDGQQVAVSVIGLSANQRVARGESTVTVVRGQEVDVTVTLAVLPQPDAGTPDGGRDAGVDAGTDAGFDAGPACGPTNCNGCCEGGMCHAGDDAGSCGKAGQACAACVAGDRCTNGACAGCNLPTPCAGCCNGSVCVTTTSLAFCGPSTEACIQCDGIAANRCNGGFCRCGPGAACGPGQHCVNDACVCDATSCPDGCCSGTTCVRPITDGQCGIGGVACRDCTTGGKTNRCSPMGACTCGTESACAASQLCVAGACACNSSSCAGCCDGTVCRGAGVNSCGPTGGFCAGCDPEQTNVCMNGQCQCGATGMMCPAGTHCTGAACTCDRTSCPNGCCQAGQCVMGDTQTACGSGGANCGTCDAGCPGGVCSTSCNAGSCSGGCCSGTTCTTAVFPTCGAMGSACRGCDARADRCDAGACVCGAGGPCGPGQFCDAGSCQCDSATCAGCCAGNTCQPGTDAGACGIGGGVCSACNPAKADNCGLGQCHCGAGAPCGPGLRCSGGVCKCDALSGCSGCCAGTATCVAQGTTTISTCGGGGVSCGTCDTRIADNCDGGACHCGTQGPCGAGLSCVGGSCVCNAGSGCTGCCTANGLSCVALQSTTNGQCGRAGQTCAACTNGNVCNNQGLCACGGNVCTGNSNCVLGTGLCL